MNPALRPDAVDAGRRNTTLLPAQPESSPGRTPMSSARTPNQLPARVALAAGLARAAVAALRPRRAPTRDRDAGPAHPPTDRCPPRRAPGCPLARRGRCGAATRLSSSSCDVELPVPGRPASTAGPPRIHHTNGQPQPHPPTDTAERGPASCTTPPPASISLRTASCVQPCPARVAQRVHEENKAPSSRPLPHPPALSHPFTLALSPPRQVHSRKP